MDPRRQLLKLLAAHQPSVGPALERALAIYRRQGGTLATLLLSEGVVDAPQLFALLTNRMGLPGLPGERLCRIRPRAEVLQRVPYQVAAAAVAVPLDLDPARNALSVAMSDPTDLQSLENLQHTSGAVEVHAYCSPHDDVVKALSRAYGRPQRPKGSGASGGAVRARVKRPAWKRGGQAAGTVQSAGAGEGGDNLATEAKVELDPSLERDIRAMGGETGPQLVRPRNPAPPSSPSLPRPPDPMPRAEDAPTPPLAKQATGPRRFAGRSLLHERPTANEATAFSVDPTSELDLDSIELEEDEPLAAMPTNLMQHRGGGQERTPSLELKLSDLTATIDEEVSPADDMDGLVRELLSSVGVLVVMLDERIDPSATHCSEYGQACRLVARELGMDELTVARLTIGGYLLGLDLALRREMGGGQVLDVARTFSLEGADPGGLGPSLRQLGARVLGMDDEGAAKSLELRVLALVARYMDLRGRTADQATGHPAAIQQLAAAGEDPTILKALSHALDTSKRTLIR